VADRADAADARRDSRHLAIGPSLAELLEPAELHDVELGVGDLAGVVQVDAYLRVPLDAGDRVYDDSLGHEFPSALAELELFSLQLERQAGRAPVRAAP
jgi:hypothetical protein